MGTVLCTFGLLISPLLRVSRGRGFVRSSNNRKQNNVSPVNRKKVRIKRAIRVVRFFFRLLRLVFLSFHENVPASEHICRRLDLVILCERSILRFLLGRYGALFRLLTVFLLRLYVPL